MFLSMFMSPERVVVKVEMRNDTERCSREGNMKPTVAILTRFSQTDAKKRKKITAPKIKPTGWDHQIEGSGRR